VRSKVIMNHASEAQTHNQEQLKRTPQLIITSDGMDTKNETKIYLGLPCEGRDVPLNYDTYRE
jgi:hypothetical protein